MLKRFGKILAAFTHVIALMPVLRLSAEND